jgi:hypothetical protein
MVIAGLAIVCTGYELWMTRVEVKPGDFVLTCLVLTLYVVVTAIITATTNMRPLAVRLSSLGGVIMVLLLYFFVFLAFKFGIKISAAKKRKGTEEEPEKEYIQLEAI